MPSTSGKPGSSLEVNFVDDSRYAAIIRIVVAARPPQTTTMRGADVGRPPRSHLSLGGIAPGEAPIGL
jgi:hypothetical protein